MTDMSIEPSWYKVLASTFGEVFCSDLVCKKLIFMLKVIVVENGGLTGQNKPFWCFYRYKPRFHSADSNTRTTIQILMSNPLNLNRHVQPRYDTKMGAQVILQCLSRYRLWFIRMV